MVFLPYLAGGAVFGAYAICQALKMRSSVALLVVLKDSLLEAPFELQLVQTIAITRDLGLGISECRLKS
jgi:hypothetical protein